MPLLRSNGKTIFFAHVPKTGGSSVEDYLTRRFGELTLVDRHRRAGLRGKGLIVSVTHLTALDLSEMLPGELDFCFALVRDPMARMLSEYRWQTGASRMSRMRFSTWLRVVLSAARREPRIYDNHIRPQSELVPEGAEIFRLEDGFEAMIARLDQVTGTTAPDLSVGHLKNRKTAAAPITVTRQDAALITGFYAADYQRFGYAPPDPQALPDDGMAALRGLLAAPAARMIVAKKHRDWLQVPRAT